MSPGAEKATDRLGAVVGADYSYNHADSVPRQTPSWETALAPGSLEDRRPLVIDYSVCAPTASCGGGNPYVTT